MDEFIFMTVAVIEFVGSVCSILVFVQDGLGKFRRRRRRKKMVD